MAFDPNNMKDRLEAAIAFMGEDTNASTPAAIDVELVDADTGPSLAEEVGAVAAPAPAETVPTKMPLKPMKRPEVAAAPARPKPTPAADGASSQESAAGPKPEPVAEATSEGLPRGFKIGNLVFNDAETTAPQNLLQIQGQWKHALIVRYVHPDKSHQDRGEQRHHPNRLMTLGAAGFEAEMIDDQTLKLRADRKEFEIKLVGAVEVVL